MNHRTILLTVLLALALVTTVGCASRRGTADHRLSSWNNGRTRWTMVEFVEKVTDPKSPDYVPPSERIAVFDNDGTLWVEKPMYTQLAFAINRVRAMAPDHPEWNDTEPFKSILAGDIRGALSGGEDAIFAILMATHAGMTTAEFQKIVEDWTDTAKHPRFDHLYTQCVYQPMVEVIRYLQANDFECYIVSGGGVEFMRPWTEEAYGIPPQQVVGSSGKTRYEMRSGTPVLVKLPEVGSIDDKSGKPININLEIGRRPVMAFGNSDGDLEMLQWTAAREGASFCALVHHTDAEREYAYDRDSDVGRLDVALDAAKANGWTLIDMKEDWKTIFPWEQDGR